MKRPDERSVVADWPTTVSNLPSPKSIEFRLYEEFALSTDFELRAAEIVAEAWNRKFVYGRTHPDTVGASVYVASRGAQQVIPPAAIADQLSFDRQCMKNTPTVEIGVTAGY